MTDFCEAGAGCLPSSFETLHATELAGPFVLPENLSVSFDFKILDNGSDVS